VRQVRDLSFGNKQRDGNRKISVAEELDMARSQSVRRFRSLKVEYSLTTLGESLKPIVDAMCEWALKHGKKIKGAQNQP